MRFSLTVMRPLIFIAFLSTLLVCTGITQAATTVTSNGATIDVVDDASAKNQIEITVDGANFRIRDYYSDLTAGTGCSSFSAKIVDCSSAGVTTVAASMNGGNDYFDASFVNLIAYLTGGSGDDALMGGPMADTIQGGPGDDAMDGGAGNDAVSGEAGFDSVQRTANANMTTDATHIYIGLEIETLDVDLEVVTLIGGGGNNTLSAAGYPWFANLIGASGNDTLIGTNSIDYLEGDGGADILSGGHGSDSILGGRGRDGLFGGNGNDLLIGGKGSDRIFGGRGNDQLVTTDRLRDRRISCGKGLHDRAQVDRDDPRALGCERVRRSTREKAWRTKWQNQRGILDRSTFHRYLLPIG